MGGWSRWEGVVEAGEEESCRGSVKRLRLEFGGSESIQEDAPILEAYDLSPWLDFGIT
jgi:hypothetical protein